MKAFKKFQIVTCLFSQSPQFAMQMIIQFQRIFLEARLPVKLRPYKILAVSSKAGLIEPIRDSLSLDKLKKQHTNLLNFFVQVRQLDR
jgi:phosphatidylinositol kinase/protein kinase (PI-3  family)